MSKLPILRSDEKLHQGSYFYIQVGHRFYAGDTAEIREVEVDPTYKPALTFFDKDGSKSAQYRERLRNQLWWTARSRGPKGPRAARDRRKGTTPTYALPYTRPKPEVRKEFTGKLSPKLVDTKEEAKKYRSRDRVDSACEKLKRCYQDLDVKVTIRLEGESK